jgi:hypothetical protein
MAEPSRAPRAVAARRCFFTNDRGVHVIDPSAGSAGQMREADSPDGWAAVLDLYHRHRLTLQQRRLDIPRRVPPLCGHNLWASNMPGSTLFIPVCDVTFSLIGLIAQFVDPKLERFAPANERGINIVDDRFGFRPAGTEAWIKSGLLSQDGGLALSHSQLPQMASRRSGMSGSKGDRSRARRALDRLVSR